MISTLEKHSSAWRTLQYGFDPVIECYQIKNYKLRHCNDISFSSLRRLERITQNWGIKRMSDYTPNWFKTVYYS